MSFGGLLSVQPNCRFRGRTPLKFAYQPDGKRVQGVLCGWVILYCVVSGNCRIAAANSLPNNVIGVAYLYFATDNKRIK